MTDTLKDAPLKAAVHAERLARSVRARLAAVRAEAAENKDRGDGPIPTVIIVLATIAGAALIAGGMAALYAKYSGKLLGP
ncbi:hypothetical protein AB0M39_40315 [Streptomyces sp. NPDC051907]|uniref:hypothetical protein n=1 Tax=Streptomyces sp. NPDC051907 TaxID=3155284 RepID=UPI0034393710